MTTSPMYVCSQSVSTGKIGIERDPKSSKIISESLGCASDSTARIASSSLTNVCVLANPEKVDNVSKKKKKKEIDRK